jgi:hypothetical protein
MILPIAAVSAVGVSPGRSCLWHPVGMALSPAVSWWRSILGLCGKRGTQTGSVASLPAFFLSAAGLELLGNPLIYSVFIGLLCGTTAYVAGSLATSRPDRAQVAVKSKASWTISKWMDVSTISPNFSD